MVLNKFELEKIEYDRLRKLFEQADENKRNAMDGLIWEAARARVNLDELNKMAMASGLIGVHPERAQLQRSLPVASELARARASYTNIIDKLCKHLCVSADDDDEGLLDYE